MRHWQEHLCIARSQLAASRSLRAAACSHAAPAASASIDNTPLAHITTQHTHRECKQVVIFGDDVSYLHLGTLVLEPEFDLERLQAQLPAQLLSLLVVRVRVLLEEPVYHPFVCYNHVKYCTKEKTTLITRYWIGLTLRAPGSGVGCGGGSASCGLAAG